MFTEYQNKSSHRVEKVKSLDDHEKPSREIDILCAKLKNVDESVKQLNDRRAKIEEDLKAAESQRTNAISHMSRLIDECSKKNAPMGFASTVIAGLAGVASEDDGEVLPRRRATTLTN